MISLQQRIESYTTLSTDLIARLYELVKLRDRLREAELNSMEFIDRFENPSKPAR